MTNDKSETERVNELKEKIEAAEAREVLAEYSGSAPEDFEGMGNESVKKLARTMAQNATRQNAYPIDQELQGAVNGNVNPTSRADWEQRRENGS